jgi:hypothetical protein
VPLLDNANIVPQLNPAFTNKQGELESAPEVAPVPDVPLLDDTKGARDTTVAPAGDVLSVPDKNLWGSDVRAVEGQAVPSISVTSVPDKTLLQNEKDTNVELNVRNTSGSDKSLFLLRVTKKRKLQPLQFKILLCLIRLQ